MDGLRDYHTKWNKSDRKIQISYDVTSMWPLKSWYKGTYLQTEIDSQTQKIKLCYQRGREGN